MSCDKYFDCPKCGKFEGLKVWMGDFFTEKEGELPTIKLDEPRGCCRYCKYEFKDGFKCETKR